MEFHRVSELRYANRRDATEPDIVDLLELNGYRVWPVDYCPFDLIVYRDDVPAFLLLECKTKHGRHTKQQTTFGNTLVGRKPWATVRTPEEALQAAKRWL